MTLTDILGVAARLLGTAQRDHVVIERGHTHAPLDGRSSVFQLRLRHDVDIGLSEYRCEARSWLGGHWSDWREQRGWLGGGGFDISDVIATDWRISS